MCNKKSTGLLRKLTGLILVFSFFCISLTGCGEQEQAEPTAEVSGEIVTGESVSGEADVENINEEVQPRYEEYATMTAEEITAALTLEQKAAQMVMPACYNTSEDQMLEKCYGAVLGRFDPREYTDWQAYIESMQHAATSSEAGVPFVYGQDDVHGVNVVLNTVLFPHNIGIGAANDEDLTYQMGQIVADEAKICRMLWNYAPCVAQSVDPRWGRTYESYGSDIESIKKLSTAFTKGLLDGGLIACPKHYLGDGNVVYGSGEKDDVEMLMDRGDAVLSEAEIKKLQSVYKALIDAGAQTIMVSHSALNGVKMHENKKYIDMLKNEMGFEGFVASDWESIQHTSGATYYDQIVNAVNAGIDMMMEVTRYDEVIDIVVEAVNKGDITEERVDDAVCRILQVKIDAGIISDPFFEKLETKQSEPGSEEYRKVAEQLVEKSQVLIKNNNKILPFKKGTKIYLTGPAADNDCAQCGGWTIDWNESPIEDIPGVTSIREGFEQVADEYGLEIITDEDEADRADVVVLCVGEKTYAEWNGDAENMDLCGDLALEGNEDAIKEAKKLGKPVVALLVAGRNIFIEKYIDGWDAVVMSYLLGSEGQGVARVMCGEVPFSGKLPSPWYADTKGIESKKPWLKRGYGLK